MGTRKARLFVDVEFDADVTDAESVASALDTLMETALSTNDILSEQGNPHVGGFCREAETAVDDLAAVVERLASKADSAGLQAGRSLSGRSPRWARWESCSWRTAATSPSSSWRARS